MSKFIFYQKERKTVIYKKAEYNNKIQQFGGYPRKRNIHNVSLAFPIFSNVKRAAWLNN